MKKYISLIIAFLMLVCFVGCGKKPAYSETVEKARDDYEKLKSAEVVISNAQTGEIQQTFKFYLDKKNVMHYYDEEKIGDKIKKEYYDGKTLKTDNNGELTIRKQGEKGFPNYSSKVRHVKASKQLIIYEPKAIKMSIEKTDKDGNYSISYTFDPKKVSFVKAEGKVKDFTVTYNFDSKKNLFDIVEETKMEADGKTFTSSYKISIDKKNEITSLDDIVR